jgi:glycosyltransferase involved in cell wall biosynthesis
MKPVDLYYVIRPLIPRAWQFAAHRWLARRIRASSHGEWPILEKAGWPPEQWTGWPEGKTFAFVLTHDVERGQGQERCRALMETEQALGFRSSFNFVPEGYAVSSALRAELTAAGFEVGVHGLRHDGLLFATRRRFFRQAPRINEYIREWNAVGFRSPSMIHNLDWIRALDIEYDSSTFDTDPFEPQPDGIVSIFPMWIAGGKTGHGYVELPYTLPQDFTLFCLLGERSIDIWKRKLDWIASRGGMALLDAHPDYMSLGPGVPGREEYPIGLYREFLEYVRNAYAGRYWHALPRDVARHFAAMPERISRRPPRKICMVAYAFYDSDNRIIRYAQTLSRNGDEVDAIALRRPGQARRELVDGIHVFRIQERERNERGKLSYLFRILSFWVRSCAVLTIKHLRWPYDLVHVHSVPDFEVFAVGFAKLMGAKVILDIHDIVPELYATKFGVSRNSTAFRLLVAIERASTAFADHVIIANHVWHKTLTSRSVGAHKCSVVMNHVDPDVFYRRARTRTDDRVVVLYPGILSWHQGIDIAVRAVALVKEKVPNVEFHIYGDGVERKALERLSAELGIQETVRFHEPVSIGRIGDLLVDTDLGVEPKRADTFADEAFSTKIPEYMSQGVPVVVSDTTVHRYYFDESCVRFFRSGDARGLADQMLAVLQDRGLREQLIRNGYAFVARNHWGVKKQEYLRLVDSLLPIPF